MPVASIDAAPSPSPAAALECPRPRSPRPRSVAQACRAVRDGGFFDLVDVTLVNCRRATGRRHALARPGILPFLQARSES